MQQNSIPAADVLDELEHAGYRDFAGVPCSYLSPLLDAVIASPTTDYVGMTNEGDAVAYACGAWLGGRDAAVLFQNSGLGNAVNPLTSLAATFRIPLLVITTLRGDPEGAGDEPQHELMGRITPGMLDLVGVPNEAFATTRDELRASLARAKDARSRGDCAGLVVRKGAIEPGARELSDAPRHTPRAMAGAPPERCLDPDEVLAAIREELAGRAALVATTGFTGRALLALGDAPEQLAMVGSMGCAASLALGIARARPDHRVVALDGDGALLMRLGVLATVGLERPANLVHVLLDNGVHDSTGAQGTAGPNVDFAAVAAACGYARATAVDAIEELPAALGGRGPVFVHVATEPRRDRRLPRPTLAPPDAARRFRAHFDS